MTVTGVAPPPAGLPRAFPMFPIIPHYLYRPAAASAVKAEAAETVEAQAEVKAEAAVPRACAEEFLPRGTTSAPFAPADLLPDGDDSDSEDDEDDLEPIRLRVGPDGTLEVKKSGGGAAAGAAWVRRLPLSHDCPSAALHLQLQPPAPRSDRSQLVVCAVRDVPAGGEVALWFSQALLPSLQLSFLGPANIRGEKQYVCHECGRQFEEPNPLKVHLALACGQLPLSCLWRRLAELSAPPSPPPPAFHFRLQRPAASASSTPASAFKPWAKRETSGAGKAPAPLPTPLTAHAFLKTALPPLAATDHLLSIQPFHRSPLLPPLGALGQQGTLGAPAPSSGLDPATPVLAPRPPLFAKHLGFLPPAEMETLVSNFGSSKHGHLCIYCGKVYSRKYGLKIHIRTHTGYKPLKCKFCLRPFGDPSNLNKHIRLHAEGETPYKCDFCGKILVRRRDLDRHIRSRHTLPTDEDQESTISFSDNDSDILHEKV